MIVSALKKFTVAIIGEAGVGKTSIIKRHIFGRFDAEYLSTIEDFYTTLVKADVSSLKNFNEDRWYELDIVDTAGMEEFKKVRDVAVQDKDAYIFIYSLRDPSSIFKLSEQLSLLRSEKKNKIPMIMAGNKEDLLNHDNSFSTAITEEVKQICCKFENNFAFDFCHCSAKYGTGIQDIF